MPGQEPQPVELERHGVVVGGELAGRLELLEGVQGPVTGEGQARPGHVGPLVLGKPLLEARHKSRGGFQLPLGDSVLNDLDDLGDVVVGQPLPVRADQVQRFVHPSRVDQNRRGADDQVGAVRGGLDRSAEQLQGLR